MTPDVEPEAEAEPEPLAASLETEPVAIEDVVPPEPESGEPEPEMAAEPVAMVEAAPAPEPEAPVESSGPDETAQWWLAAWARWSGWKSSHDFASAVREELGKYPVPALGTDPAQPRVRGRAARLRLLDPDGPRREAEPRLRGQRAQQPQARPVPAGGRPALRLPHRRGSSPRDLRRLRQERAGRRPARAGRVVPVPHPRIQGRHADPAAAVGPHRGHRAVRAAPGQRRSALQRAQVQDDPRRPHHPLHPGLGRRQGGARRRLQGRRRRRALRTRAGW